jgi:hypothetical protein
VADRALAEVGLFRLLLVGDGEGESLVEQQPRCLAADLERVPAALMVDAPERAVAVVRAFGLGRDRRIEGGWKQRALAVTPVRRQLPYRAI